MLGGALGHSLRTALAGPGHDSEGARSRDPRDQAASIPSPSNENTSQQMLANPPCMLASVLGSSCFLGSSVFAAVMACSTISFAGTGATRNKRDTGHVVSNFCATAVICLCQKVLWQRVLQVYEIVGFRNGL